MHKSNIDSGGPRILQMVGTGTMEAKIKETKMVIKLFPLNLPFRLIEFNKKNN